MRGIILKDFYESFCLRKNLIGMLFSFAVVTTLVIWMRDAYSYVLLVLLMMPMIGVSTLQYSMEQDEISGYDEILLTFPLTKSEIVLAKRMKRCCGRTAMITTGYSLPCDLCTDMQYAWVR